MKKKVWKIISKISRTQIKLRLFRRKKKGREEGWKRGWFKVKESLLGIHSSTTHMTYTSELGRPRSFVSCKAGYWAAAMEASSYGGLGIVRARECVYLVLFFLGFRAKIEKRDGLA